MMELTFQVAMSIEEENEINGQLSIYRYQFPFKEATDFMSVGLQCRPNTAKTKGWGARRAARGASRGGITALGRN
jgi:hypothetical protein